MGRFLWFIVFMFANIHLIYTQSHVDIGGQYAYRVLHSFEKGPNPQYVLRGYISTQSTKTGIGTFIQDSPLSSEDINHLKELANDGGMYRLMLVSNVNNVEIAPVFSFTKACAVYQSGLTDTISIALNQAGQPISIGVSASPSHCLGDPVPDSKLRIFNTSVNIISVVNAPMPDTLTYIQRVEQEKAEKARGEHGDTRSFLSKYWMYIVPLLVFLFISGASGPEGQASGR